ncbi:zymogen granule protein 16 homolog B [Gracilinanus agilis]|uniref:zymogen granule protein 16 homolog B n=1 Tax=Gracilinanus agilis TaxID=191870 RepID=UPI001CFE5E6C|nr:zymogen granule protein 16 homolog B [Gracilinanus agilis]
MLLIPYGDKSQNIPPPEFGNGDAKLPDPNKYTNLDPQGVEVSLLDESCHTITELLLSTISSKQTMALFLVLFLLGGIAGSFCEAMSGDIIGTAKGIFFFLGGDNPNDVVKGLAVRTGSAGLMKSIEIKINNQWSTKRGAPGGNREEMTLWEDEKIKSIRVCFRLCLLCLEIETSKGRKFIFGKITGTQRFAYPPKEGMTVSAVYGQYNGLCMTGIGLLWKYSPTAPPSILTKPPSTPTEPPSTTPTEDAGCYAAELSTEETSSPNATSPSG